MHIKTFHRSDYDGDMELNCQFSARELRELLQWAMDGVHPQHGPGAKLYEVYSQANDFLSLPDLRPKGLDSYYKHWENGNYIDAQPTMEPDGIERKEQAREDDPDSPTI